MLDEEATYLAQYLDGWIFPHLQRVQADIQYVGDERGKEKYPNDGGLPSVFFHYT